MIRSRPGNIPFYKTELKFSTTAQFFDDQISGRQLILSEAAQIVRIPLYMQYMSTSRATKASNVASRITDDTDLLCIVANRAPLRQQNHQNDARRDKTGPYMHV